MDFVKLWNRLEGSRTHLASAALIVVGLLGLTGQIDPATLMSLGLTAAGAIGVTLRLAIAKLPEKQQDALYRLFTLWRSVSEQIQPQPPVDPRPASSLGVMLLIFVLGTTTASAAEVRIVGPKGVPVAGYPAELFIQGAPLGSTIGWDSVPRYEGLPFVEPQDDGYAAKLNTMAGAWKLIVAITPPGEPTVFRYFDFTVPGTAYVPIPGPSPQPLPIPVPPPPTPPLPPPNPPPVPPKPDPLPPPSVDFQIADRVAAIASTINSPQRAVEVVRLADAAEALAGQVAAGTVKRADDVMVRIGQGIKGLNSSAWSAVAPKFTALMKETWETHGDGPLQLTEDGDIVEPTSWSDLLREIATGLRRVR